MSSASLGDGNKNKNYTLKTESHIHFYVLAYVPQTFVLWVQNWLWHLSILFNMSIDKS
jgi:hypothetical protein